MATDNDAIVVLDEGMEETLDNLATCCKPGSPIALKPPQ